MLTFYSRGTNGKAGQVLVFITWITTSHGDFGPAKPRIFSTIWAGKGYGEVSFC
jgi:hypothetical protein